MDLDVGLLQRKYACLGKVVGRALEPIPHFSFHSAVSVESLRWKS